MAESQFGANGVRHPAALGHARPSSSQVNGVDGHAWHRSATVEGCFGSRRLLRIWISRHAASKPPVRQRGIRIIWFSPTTAWPTTVFVSKMCVEGD